MKHNLKSFLTTPFVCLILIISMFALPFSANAEAGTLGKETPNLTCVFTDNTGKIVDGNRLTSGNYTVDVVLSGMKSVSIVELTATYNTSVITGMAIKSTYADTATNMKKGGQKVESGSLSVFQVAENVNSSAIDTNGTVMVSLSVTVNTESSCDFEDVFEFSKDPNLCFIEADYGDGYDDCYVLDTTVETSYKTYPMSADASPYFIVTEFDILGSLTVATELSAEATATPAANVNVTLKKNNVVVAQTVTDENGSYTFDDIFLADNVQSEEYTLTFSGASTIDREAKLIVARANANYDKITVASVGIVNVDYNKDGKINAVDVAMFTKDAQDLNNDGAFDDEDGAIMKNFFKKTVSYTQTTLQ